MRTHLGKPVALPYVDQDDVALLAGELGAGYFPAEDLYRWYAGLVEERGRKPVSKKALGMAFKEAGLKASVRRIDGRPVRCWLLTNPWKRRGDKLIAEEKAGFDS